MIKINEIRITNKHIENENKIKKRIIRSYSICIKIGLIIITQHFTMIMTD